MNFRVPHPFTVLVKGAGFSSHELEQQLDQQDRPPSGPVARPFAFHKLVSAPRSNTPPGGPLRVKIVNFDPITASAPFERVDLVAVRTTKARRKGADAVIGSKFNFNARVTRPFKR
jgi:hypothetical protein